MSATAWLVSGPPGGGKSTLAPHLARRLGAALLDRDSVTAPLTRVVAGLIGVQADDLDDPRMQRALGDAAYASVLAAARGVIEVGLCVVVVAPFTQGLATPGAATQLRAALAGAPVRVVWVDCPVDERRRRLLARGAARDLRKLEADALTPGLAPSVPHARIDARASLDVQLEAALQAPLALPGASDPLGVDGTSTA